MRFLLVVAIGAILAGCAVDGRGSAAGGSTQFSWTYLNCGSGMEANDCDPEAQFTSERSCLAHLRLSGLYCNFADARDGIVICREYAPVPLPSSLKGTARCVPTGAVS
jgi:hypothetical protein